MVKKKKILIIEDEKSISYVLKLKLEYVGFEATIAKNGEEGIFILGGKKFDLALLDIIMPKMDGFKVLEIIKEKKIKMPVAMLSNLSQSDDEKRAFELGAIVFFVKSNTQIAEIVEWIKKKLE